MRAEADQLQVGQIFCLGVVLVDLRQRDAELAVAMAGRNVRMGSRVEIRIDAQADRRVLLHPARNLGNAMQARRATRR